MVKFVFKVIIIGPGAVGKTSLLRRYVENRFSENYKLTIGVDFMTKVVEFKPGDSAKLTIWDIGGQERYKFLHESFFEKTNGALIVFDLTRPSTFNEIDNWVKELREYAGDRVPFIVLGNKLDLIEDIGQITERDEVQQVVNQEGGVYIETSAKTGDNVAKSFIELTKLMVKEFAFLG